MELQGHSCETLQEKCNDTYIAVVNIKNNNDDELISSAKTELIPLFEKSVIAECIYHDENKSNTALEIKNSLRNEICVVQDKGLCIPLSILNNDVQPTNNFDLMNLEHDSDINKEIFENLKSKTNSNYENIFMKNNDGFYECFKCMLTTKYLSYIQSHVYKHLKIKPYACFYCNFETIYFYNFKLHNQLHLEYNQPLSKLEEIKSFDFSSYGNLKDLSPIGTASNFSSFNASSLELHIKTHCKESKTLKCSECPFEAKTNFGLKIHIGRQHQRVDIYKENSNKVLDTVPNNNKMQGFSCTLCPFVAVTLGGLNVHKHHHTKSGLNMIENNLKYYSCSFCPLKSFSRNYVKNHKYTAHKNITSSVKTKSKKQLCSIRGREESRDSKLMKKSMFACPLCLFFGATQDDLASHKTNEHSDVGKTETALESFSCSRCPYVAISAAGLKIHLMKIHYKKSRKNKLKNNSNFISCKLCPFKSSVYSSLYYHLKVVHNQSSSKSDVTKIKGISHGKMSNRENIETVFRELKKDRLIQRKEKIRSFSCTRCPFVCSTKQAIDKHKSHRHSSQISKIDATDLCSLYICDRCVFRSNSKRSIQSHMYNHKIRDKTQFKKII